jgi:protein subunit release factor A
MREIDCRVDIYTGAGSSMRIVHVPTGLTVTGEITKSQLLTKTQLMNELAARLVQHLASERDADELGDEY